MRTWMRGCSAARSLPGGRPARSRRALLHRAPWWRGYRASRRSRRRRPSARRRGRTASTVVPVVSRSRRAGKCRSSLARSPCRRPCRTCGCRSGMPVSHSTRPSPCAVRQHADPTARLGLIRPSRGRTPSRALCRRRRRCGRDRAGWPESLRGLRRARASVAADGMRPSEPGRLRRCDPRGEEAASVGRIEPSSRSQPAGR